MKKQTVNAGYEICRSRQVDVNVEIVIGHNPVSDFWVCWTRFDGDDCRFGTYSEDPQIVFDEFQDRVYAYRNIVF